MAHYDCGWTCWCADKTDPLRIHAIIWALLRWWFTTKRRYIKCMHLYVLDQVNYYNIILQAGTSLFRTPLGVW